MVVLYCRTSTSWQQGGGSQEPRTDDFPTVEGLLRIQGIRGEVAAARRRSGLFVFVIDVIQKDRIVILLCFWIVL